MQTTNEAARLVALRHNATRLISIVMLVSCAFLLTIHTVGLQNSCNPLLDWTNISTRHCSPKPDRDSKQSDPPKPEPTPGTGSDNSCKGKDPSQCENQSGSDKHEDNNPSSNTGKVVKEVAGVAAGSIAVVGMAVVEAPVLAAAGVGIAVWLAFRTLFSSDG